MLFRSNNQIGFTTAPRFARSSPYPSDVAKIAQAPIFHVNGDDPEAVVYCAKIATEYRQKFNRDVVIDMVCYRRFGHNEGDEPSFTQPIMYKKIKSHPTTLSIYGKKLSIEGLTSPEKLQKDKTDFKNYLEKEFETSKNYKSELKWFDGAWSRFKPGLGKDKRGVSGVDKNKLLKIGKKISTIPDNFNVHKTLKRIFELKSGSIFVLPDENENYLMTIVNEKIPKIDINSTSYKNYQNKAKELYTAKIYKSYDSYINQKYKIDIKKNVLKRIENSF